MRKLGARAAVAVMVGVASFAGAQEAVKVTVEGGGCARTPAAAIQAAKGVPGALLLSQKEGFRVQTVRWDPLQHQSWAVVRSCEHPELPALTMLTDLPPNLAPSVGLGAGTVGASVGVSAAGTIAAVLTRSAAIIRENAAVAIVKAGDVVRLWKSERNARIELIATAEENGSLGARIRVRMTARRETDGQTEPPRYLAGVVRGPADVEIEP